MYPSRDRKGASDYIHGARRPLPYGRGSDYRRGFTFLEILIAVVILAILTAVLFPKIGFIFRSGQLEAAGRDLAATLRYARQAAILSGGGCEVRFDPQGGRFLSVLVRLDIEGYPLEEAPKKDNKEKSFRLSDDAAQAHSLPGDVFFTFLDSTAPPFEGDQSPRIIFHPDGSATAATIGIQNSEAKALNIEVYRTTGMAMVRPGDPIVPQEKPPLYYLPEKLNYQTMTTMK